MEIIKNAKPSYSISEDDILRDDVVHKVEPKRIIDLQEELLNEIDNYFNNVTKEQFLKDVEEAGCLHLLEDE